MLTLPPSVRIFLATTFVDMRRGHDGLCAVVRDQWQVDLFAGNLFVFLSRRGDRCKILFWDHGGFVVYYKRLELGRFRLPVIPDDATKVCLDSTQLTMLLDGIDVAKVERPRRWVPPISLPNQSAPQ